VVKTAIILAGGLGTRLRTLVNDRPKPMAIVDGTPFLAILINYWVKQGIKRFILSVGYKYEVIQSYFGSEYKGCKIDYSIEDNPLGTGGAFIQAASYLGNEDSFLLINGDTYFEVNLHDFYNYLKLKNADWLIALTKKNDNVRYGGVCIGNSGVIDFKNRITKKTELVNGGLYIINPLILKKIKKIKFSGEISLEKDIFPKLNNFGISVFGKYYSNNFIDIGMPEDYKYAAKKIFGKE